MAFPTHIMRKKFSLISMLALAMLLVACSKQEEQKQLTRVDVQRVNIEGNYEDEVIIADHQLINSINSALEHVNWEPNTKAEMERNEDILATLFYSLDKNMPERLYQYRIWINKNGTTTIISNNEKEGYGRLDKEHSKILINILIK